MSSSETPLTSFQECLEVLNTPSEYRLLKNKFKIYSYLKSMHPFVKYLHATNQSIEKEILLELSSVLIQEKFNPNDIVKKMNDKDSIFMLILQGKIGELSLKYEKQYLTEEEYLTHLIKLQLLSEKEILNECIKLNKTIFPVNSDIITWITKYREVVSFDYISKAKAQITELQSIAQESNIDYYIYMTNPYSLISYTNRIDTKTQYSITLPLYYLSQTLDKGNYIGTLAINKRFKLYSTYVCNEETTIGLIDKKNPAFSNTISLIEAQIKESLEDVMNSFFIFNYLNNDYLNNSLAPLHTHKFYNKGDYLLKQNTHHEGIYLIKNGHFKISTVKRLDELNELIVELKQSLDNYLNYKSNLNENIIEDFPHGKYILDPVYRTPEYIAYNKISQEVVITNIHTKVVIGLNEYFSSKTDINHFNVQCISETAEVYFLPKESYFSLLGKEKELMQRACKQIEQTARFFIETIRKSKGKFITEIKNIIEKNKQKNQAQSRTKNNEFYYQNLNSLYNSSLLVPKIIAKAIMKVSKITPSYNPNATFKSAKSMNKTRQIFQRSLSQKLLFSNDKRIEKTRKMFAQTLSEKFNYGSSISNRGVLPYMLNGENTNSPCLPILRK